MAQSPIWEKSMEREADIRKKALRQRINAERSALSPHDRAEKCRSIYRNVTEHPAFLRARIIYIFVDAKGETDTREIIRQAWCTGKRVAVPRIENKRMQFYYIENFTDLNPGHFGIEEPKAECRPAENMKDALMVMPGVVFDRQRNRIGYGGGYYDRYLSEHPDLPTIAIAFSLQVLEKIPSEAHDIKPDILITDNCVH